jgi:hypothetical protein
MNTNLPDMGILKRNEKIEGIMRMSEKFTNKLIDSFFQDYCAYR